MENVKNILVSHSVLSNSYRCEDCRKTPHGVLRYLALQFIPLTAFLTKDRDQTTNEQTPRLLFFFFFFASFLGELSQGT